MVLGCLHEPRVDAPPPMMFQIQMAGLVSVDQTDSVPGVDPSEVVASGKDDQVPGETVPTDMGYLPGLARTVTGK